MTMAEKLVNVLNSLNGIAHLSEIYKEYGRLYGDYREASIRGCLERNSSDSECFNGRNDLFELPYGKGKGMWALRGHYTKV